MPYALSYRIEKCNPEEVADEIAVVGQKGNQNVADSGSGDASQGDVEEVANNVQADIDTIQEKATTQAAGPAVAAPAVAQTQPSTAVAAPAVAQTQPSTAVAAPAVAQTPSNTAVAASAQTFGDSMPDGNNWSFGGGF